MRLTQEQCLEKYAKKAIKYLPATRAQIQKKLKVSESVAKKTLQHLKNFDRLHVSGWTKSGCADAPIYSKGEGIDATRPPAKPHKRPKPVVREIIPFKLPARCFPKIRHGNIEIKTNWIGGTPTFKGAKCLRQEAN